MAVQYFDLTIGAEGSIFGERLWTGNQMHSTWNVENLQSSNNSVWGVNADGWLQYRSAFNTYAMRYNPLDLTLEDYYFETIFRPAGTGNYEVGVMFRFESRNSFYFIVFNGGHQNWNGNNLRLMKRSGVNNFVLAECEYPVFSTSKDYKMRVEVEGGHIKAWLDDNVIFDYIDGFPILRGAFGPIVRGQEFARWKEFHSHSYTGFLLTKTLTNCTVDSIYTLADSEMVFSETVSELMQDKLNEFILGKDFNSVFYDRFTIHHGNPRVHVVFDKISGKNMTTDQHSRIYAYQELPVSPPLPVTDLRGYSLSDQSIRLAWSYNDHMADGFQIVDENDQVIATVGHQLREFIEQELTEGTTYKRRVIAYNEAGNAEPSNEVVVTTLVSPPVAPSDLRGEAIDHEQIKWTWTDHSDNEAEFDLVEKDHTGQIRVVAVVPKNTTSYIEKGLETLTEYTRYVRSRNVSGVSELSNPATVKTKDILPDPPKLAPANFTGVGTSDSTILWSWIDYNHDIRGFRIYDEQDRLIAEIDASKTFYQEEELYSAMEYRRKICAFNEGGDGPKTDLVWAKTLTKGQDQIGTPIEPINLYADEIQSHQALLIWDYHEHHLLPADGFRIYDENDILIDTIPVTERSRIIQGLVPDSTYTYYIVAFNVVGDSLPSNVATFVTKGVEAEEQPIDPPIQNDLIDPWHHISYDAETEDTPKISAFHSGVGDQLDLVVKNLHEHIQNTETFTFDAYVKGIYEVEEIGHPLVPFRYRLEIAGSYEGGAPYSLITPWQTASVRHLDSIEGIRFDDRIDHEPIPDNVLLTDNSFIVHVEDMDGNPIPDFRESPNEEVHWIYEQRRIEENVGFVEEIDMKNVYNDWQKFSHQGKDQPSKESELSSWTYNEETQEMLTTVNSTTFHGAVSPDAYNNYDMTVQLRSNAADNDRMAVILAFVVDEDGKEHTLSAIRSHEESNWDWAIWYNYRQPTQLMIDRRQIDGEDRSRSWNYWYPSGTIVRVIRNEDEFTIRATGAGDSEFHPNSEITFSLNDDPRFAKFKGAKQIGFAAHSQQHAGFYVKHFEGDKVRIFYDHYLTAWTNKVAPIIKRKEWRSAVVTSEEMKIQTSGLYDVEVRIQSPAYQIPWQEINEQHSFLENEYRLVFTSNNPNVELFLEKEEINFFPSESTFISVPLKARVVNHTQTSWHPNIHSGYYYLNQREYYLYSDDRVLPKDLTDRDQYKYSFPYVLRAYAERYHVGGDITFVDSETNDFLLGRFDHRITILPLSEQISLKEGFSQGEFISRIFNFGQKIDTWIEPIIQQDTEAIQHGAEVIFEIGEVDETGVVQEWSSIDSLKEASRVRYRLTLKEGYKKELYTTFFEQYQSLLEQGRMTNIQVEDGSISIRDPEFFAEGLFITKPIHYGDHIEDMGTVKIKYDDTIGRVELYSVSANDALHNFHIPTSTEPWIPLRLIERDGHYLTYKIDSPKKPYLAIVAKLIREDHEITSMRQSPVLSNISVEPILFDQIRVVPTIDSIKIGGHLSAGHWSEEYLVPLTGEVIADGSYHNITTESAETIVDHYLSSIGVHDIQGLSFKDYIVEADPIYPVQLKTNLQGKSKIEARTTEDVGDIMYLDSRIFFDEKTQDVVLTPIPQNGTPIVVKNAQGRLLRPVHFRDEKGQPTLYNTEYHVTNETPFLFLQHREHEIDIPSLVVYVDIAGDQQWSRMYSARIVENRIIFPFTYVEGTAVRIYYRLKDSYTIDYNYDPQNDAARLIVNTPFSPEFKETRELYVKYEVNKDHAYYIAEEVDLNPLRNKLNTGFIYISDQYYPPYRLDIQMNPTTLYSNKKDRAMIHAYVYDENDNPVVNERILWESDIGTLYAQTSVTDQSGMAAVIYEAPTGEHKEAMVRATVLSRTQEHHLSKELSIQLVQESFKGKISIIPEKDIVQTGDIVQLKVIATGPTNERVTNETISITSNQGSVFPSTGATNHQGELTFEYTHTNTSSLPYIVIMVESSSGMTEQILLGTSGV